MMPSTEDSLSVPTLTETGMPSRVLLLDAQDGSTTRAASEEVRASSPRRAWKRWDDARIVGVRSVDSTPDS